MQTATFTAADGTRLNYVLHTVGERDEQRPLLIYLHGGDGRGDDPTRLLQIESLPRYIEEGKLQLTTSAVILAPQCPEGRYWKDVDAALMELIDHLIEQENLDPNRISLTGCSLGGMGTFTAALAHPERFSCLVPVCASVDAARCGSLTMPVWIFHGELDDGMGFSVVEANCVMKKAHNNSRLTLLENEGHEIRWIYYAERFRVVDWMLEKRR